MIDPRALVPGDAVRSDRLNTAVHAFSRLSRFGKIVTVCGLQYLPRCAVQVSEADGHPVCRACVHTLDPEGNTCD